MKNPWTTQFKNLPENLDIDPAVSEKFIQERIFHCEGANCPIEGKVLTRGEGMLKFVKIIATKAMMEPDDITPQRDGDGDPLVERTDMERLVLCDHHVRLQEMRRDELMQNLPEALRKRGDKLEVETSTLFQNLSWVKKMIQRAKRPERVRKFFMSLTEGASIDAGIALDCIQPLTSLTSKDKKSHNFLVRGGELLGILPWEDVDIYHGVRHQHKGAFIAANMFLHANSTLAWVEERLVDWRKTADEDTASKAECEAKAAERLAAAKARTDAEIAEAKSGAAELLAFFVGAATPTTETSTGDDGRKERREGRQPKQRKSSPPPSAARQIDEQLEAGGRATLSDDTPDVIVDEHAGETRPTSAVALGDRPEVAKQLAAARAAITDSK